MRKLILAAITAVAVGIIGCSTADLCADQGETACGSGCMPDNATCCGGSSYCNAGTVCFDDECWSGCYDGVCTGDQVASGQAIKAPKQNVIDPSEQK